MSRAPCTTGNVARPSHVPAYAQAAGQDSLPRALYVPNLRKVRCQPAPAWPGGGAYSVAPPSPSGDASGVAFTRCLGYQIGRRASHGEGHGHRGQLAVQVLGKIDRWSRRLLPSFRLCRLSLAPLRVPQLVLRRQSVSADVSGDCRHRGRAFRFRRFRGFLA